MYHGVTVGSRSMVDSQPWVARPLRGSRGRRDSSKRERSSGFSLMVPLGGGAA
jgi:hypothetical protein